MCALECFSRSCVANFVLAWSYVLQVKEAAARPVQDGDEPPAKKPCKSFFRFFLPLDKPAIKTEFDFGYCEVRQAGCPFHVSYQLLD